MNVMRIVDKLRCKAIRILGGTPDEEIFRAVLDEKHIVKTEHPIKTLAISTFFNKSSSEFPLESLERDMTYNLAETIMAHKLFTLEKEACGNGMEALTMKVHILDIRR